MVARAGSKKGGAIVLPSLESRALKYGYSNARVRAMKGLLIKSATLSEMVRVASIEGVIELLQRTAYKSDLSSASASFTHSRLVEIAASRNFARAAEKVIKMAPKSDKAALSSLLLKWDMINLKTILHAKKLGKSFDEIRPALFPVGGMDEDDFRRILKTDERDLFREVRRTRLGEQLLEKEWGQSGMDIAGVFKTAFANVDSFIKHESELDTYIYLVIDRSLRSTGSKEAARIAEILKLEIDAKNILIIERLKKHNADRSRIMKSLIRGGTIGDSTLGKLIEAKDLAATTILVRHKFPRLSVPADEHDLGKLEIALEKAISAQRLDAFYTSILSIGVLIGFLLLKEEEVSNLRKIAKGKEFGMNDDQIKDMLVLPG